MVNYSASEGSVFSCYDLSHTYTFNELSETVVRFVDIDGIIAWPSPFKLFFFILLDRVPFYPVVREITRIKRYINV